MLPESKISGWWHLTVAAVILALVMIACGDPGPSCEELGGSTKVETVWEYRYGLNPANGKFEFSYGPSTRVWCDQ